MYYGIIYQKSVLFEGKMVALLFLTNQYYLYSLPGHVLLVSLTTHLSVSPSQPFFASSRNVPPCVTRQRTAARETTPPVAKAPGVWWRRVQIWLEKVESLDDNLSMLFAFPRGLSINVFSRTHL